MFAIGFIPDRNYFHALFANKLAGFELCFSAMRETVANAKSIFFKCKHERQFRRRCLNQQKAARFTFEWGRFLFEFCVTVLASAVLKTGRRWPSASEYFLA